jgi:hypothetical protein
MNSSSPSRINASAIPTLDNSAAVAGINGLWRAFDGRRVGEGNVMDSPQGRTNRGDATPFITTEKVSAGASEAPAIPDLTEFRHEPVCAARRLAGHR